MADNVPWCTRFIPTSLVDVVGQNDIVNTFRTFTKNQTLTNLFLYGPPGTGKTSAVHALARDMYNHSNVDSATLAITIDNNLAVEVVRKRVTQFATSTSMFCMVPFKMVIVDEIDQMSEEVQIMFRDLVNTCTSGCFFVFIANSQFAVDQCLLRSLVSLMFPPVRCEDMLKYVTFLLRDRMAFSAFTEEAISNVCLLSKGDLRHCLNMLQMIVIRFGSITTDTVRQSLWENETVLSLNTLLTNPSITPISLYETLLHEIHFNSMEFRSLIQQCVLFASSRCESKNAGKYIQHYVTFCQQVATIDVNCSSTVDFRLQLCSLVLTMHSLLKNTTDHPAAQVHV